MNSKAEQTRSPLLDTLWLVVAVVMLLGGIAAYYYFEDAAITPVRVGGLIAVTLLAAWVSTLSYQGATFFRFLKEADIERRKVIWPTHQETLQTALMVLVVTIIISLILWAIDSALGAIVRALLGGG